MPSERFARHPDDNYQCFTLILILCLVRESYVVIVNKSQLILLFVVFVVPLHFFLLRNSSFASS